MVFTNRLLAYRQPEYVESNQYVSAILQKHLEKSKQNMDEHKTILFSVS